MRIESLRCWHCGTSITGRIAIPLLARLPGEQAEFVEKFLLANGSLSEVQKLMKCSYPKVRRLLNDTMIALKIELKADLHEKEEILKALEENRLNGKDALKLIGGLIEARGYGRS